MGRSRPLGGLPHFVATVKDGVRPTYFRTDSQLGLAKGMGFVPFRLGFSLERVVSRICRLAKTARPLRRTLA